MARSTFPQRLTPHQSRIGETCFYMACKQIMAGTLTAVRWEDAYLEMDLHLTGPRLGKLLDLQTLTVGCARPYLVVEDHALSAAGHVSWLLLTEPGQVRELMAALAAGLDGKGKVEMLRGFLRR